MPRRLLRRAGAPLAVLALAACHPPSLPSSDERSLSARQLLGKRLFEDAELSEPPGQSCASCHDAAQAFAGNHGSPIAAVALGSRPDQLGARNVPTAMYAAFSPRFAFVAQPPGEGAEVGEGFLPIGGLFWDGRADDLVEQAKGPFLNPREMNNPDPAAVVAKVRASRYAGLFYEVYGARAFVDVDLAYAHVADAIAAFESTPRFAPFSSKFDRFLVRGEPLGPEEARGFALFTDPDKGNCLRCHVGDPASQRPQDWLFTDFTYDNLGLPRNAAIPDNHDPAHFDLGLCQRPELPTLAPVGVEVEDLCGSFKVPTLRNVARTAPYGHNGVFTTLRDVVRFYATRDTNPELWYGKRSDGTIEVFDDLPPVFRSNVNTTEVPYGAMRGAEPALSDSEIDAIVAFLQTLTDE